MAATVDQEFEKLLQHLKHARGFDFTAYKRSTLQRRIEKRMQTAHANTFAEYLDFLESHPDEFQSLFNTILINVTSFFRDKEDWDFLRDQVLPQIVSSCSGERPLRVWSAGCASGEEAYSIAILLSEALGAEVFKEQVKIYATDVDEEALAQGRSATYSLNQLQGVPVELLQRYFQRNGNAETLVFDRDLRRSVIFGRHDLIQDVPISRVDLLLCRNTLMYFQREAQDRILSRFYFALNDGHYLFLGQAETLLSHNPFFSAFDKRHRVFTKIARMQRFERGAAIAATDGILPRSMDGQGRLREAILDGGPLAQIVIDSRRQLYIANEKARSLFNIAAKDIGRPIQDLEISYRPVELRSAIEQTISTRRLVEQKEVVWTAPGAESVVLDLKMTPLFDESTRLLGVAVTWEDVSHYKRLQEELINFNQDLETAYEELQSTNEELQTTNEELQSTVEELETTNEELQSTNEELETMNEELQSTNEEMEAINDEHSQKSDELNEANAFLYAVLAGLSDGVIVLDQNLQVLAWNPKAQDLWGLRPEEVLGKHLMNLDILLPTEPLRPLIKSVLTGQTDGRKIELECLNRRGQKVHLLTEATPLPAANGEPRGVILTTKNSAKG